MAEEFITSTARSRLAAAMQYATEPDDRTDYTFSQSDNSLGVYRTSGGLDNPYGPGLAAYEPHTVIFDGYKDAYDRVESGKQKEAYDKAIASAHTTTIDFRDGGTPLGDATGKMGAAINAAMDLANRRVPYVWGGTTRNGVDCSGLIYYAFRSAGINIPRYRASDYGKMGQAVSQQDARPGDIVYYDEPGDTDHVGIYLGNGKMIQAPQTGDIVRVSNVGHATSFRRVFTDGAFTQTATPTGVPQWMYGEQPAATTTWGAAPLTARPRTTVRTNTQFQRAL